jgi:hypothetical protein
MESEKSVGRGANETLTAARPTASKAVPEADHDATSTGFTAAQAE